jgi:hypothetical protein
MYRPREVIERMQPRMRRPGDGTGSERTRIINRKQAGSHADMPEIVYGVARELNVFADADDITIDGH